MNTTENTPDASPSTEINTPETKWVHFMSRAQSGYFNTGIYSESSSSYLWEKLP